MQPDDHENDNGQGNAVVVLGHGSRAAGSGSPLEWVARQLADRLDCPVTPAFLQFNEPGLADCCRELARGGSRHIFIAPYFLFSGNHILRDIPEEIGELEAEFPEVAFTLAPALGIDDHLVGLLQKRLEQSGYAPAPAIVPAGQHPIESESFTIIDSLVEPEDPDDPRYVIARRVVHATGDPGLVDALAFSDGAVKAAGEALAKGAAVYCDVNMVAAGIEPTAVRAGLEVACGIARADTGRLAAAAGITRGAAAFRRQHSEDNSSLDGAVIVVGNAPTALFEVLRLAREEGVRPALVIGVPVGFVGAAESKEELATSGLDYVTLPGNRGGSNIAAAVFNALVKLRAADREGERS
ncbi:MAG: precorrin-8X methylmutase [Thermoleophilia bacterium]